MRCQTSLPPRGNFRQNMTRSSMMPPLKSRYEAVLSTHVCFHCPVTRSNVERLRPSSLVPGAPLNSSRMAQPPRILVILLELFTGLPSSRYASSHSPIQKSSCLDSGESQPYVVSAAS